MGLATYEAVVSGMSGYKSIANVFPGLQIPQADPNQVYHWPLVVNAVYGYMMPRIFLDATQQHKDKIANQERALELHYDNVSGDIRQRSIDHGRAVAKTVFDWASTDLYGHNSHRDPFRNYVPPQGPGLWVPTFPGPGNGMFPFWGKARTFAINEADKLCPPPIPYSTSPISPYYSQALEVYSMTTPLSYTNQWIAEFWSDDLVNLTFSPGPRWSAIANQVLQKEKSSLETAVVVHAKVGMALNDAAVACWHSKYVYNVERPVSYIKEFIDPNWREPLVNPLTGDKGISPSFPAYPSGHSTMGAAGAEILTSIFGSHYVLTDRCHEFRSEFIGTPRTFHNFYEMAEENAFSRIVLGVHFRMDCEQGVNLGYRVARKVNGLPWRR
jgi:membrane-associated phospholipid phosphatase